jgi:hypothetical protein
VSQHLTINQIANLISYVNKGLYESVFEIPDQATREIPFSTRVVVPVIQEIVKSTKKNGLYVRGEGGHPVKSIYEAEMEFKPDITIGFHNDLHIAFEVKIIRPGDPSGSFSKAIGQALAYRSLGSFDASFALLFDVRDHAPLRHSGIKASVEEASDNVFVFVW